VLAVWSAAELKPFKRARLSEIDPATGGLAQWRGILMRDLIDKSMEGLTVENQARIDLVVVEGGARALIPRSFVRKYGVILAENKERPLHSVVPWSTEREAVRKEILPVESYFVQGVRRIVLTGSDESYRSVLLLRRTDPLAIRGESLFVRACMGCHARGDWPDIQGVSNRLHRRWEADANHPRVSGLPAFGDPEMRALRSYLKAAREENPNRIQTAQSGP